MLALHYIYTLGRRLTCFVVLKILSKTIVFGQTMVVRILGHIKMIQHITNLKCVFIEHIMNYEIGTISQKRTNLYKPGTFVCFVSFDNIYDICTQ